MSDKKMNSKNFFEKIEVTCPICDISFDLYLSEGKACCPKCNSIIELSESDIENIKSKILKKEEDQRKTLNINYSI